MVYAADKPFRPGDFDAELLSRHQNQLTTGPALAPGARRQWVSRGTICPAGLFARAATIDLVAPLRVLSSDVEKLPGVAIDIECRVTKGAVGIGLVDAEGAYIPGAEASVEEGADSRLVTLRAVGVGLPGKLVVRNLRAEGRSVFALSAAVLRPAN